MREHTIALMNEVEKKLSRLRKEKGNDFVKDFTFTKKWIDIREATHMKMVQEPWQRLGIAIDRLIDKTIDNKDDWVRCEAFDYTYQIDLEDCFDFAKDMCKGFFENFYSEIDEMIYSYYFELKCKIKDLDQAPKGLDKEKQGTNTEEELQEYNKE